MCLMAPALVVAVDGSTCEVELGGRVDQASMLLEPDLAVGDWVLVNSGTVVRVLDEEQAAEMSRAFGIIYGLDDDGDGDVSRSLPATDAPGSAAAPDTPGPQRPLGSAQGVVD